MRNASAFPFMVVVWASLLLGRADAQSLAWDLPSGATATGFVVIIDGVRNDKGLTPLGAAGACGCSTPLGLSGGNHTIVVGAYNASGESDAPPLVIGPSANAGGPYSGTAGMSMAVDGSKSSAPTGSLVRYSWNWGDGSATTSTSSTASAHTYAAAGTYTVTLTVTDNAGATSSATTTATVAAGSSTGPPSSGTPLSAPWASQDIGSVGLAGSATVSGSTYSIAGAGSDVWGTADAFRFAYQSLSGDGTIVARVTGEQNTDTYAKAGIMFRESLATGAADVILDVRPGGAIEFMSRSATNGSTAYLGGASLTFPAWLKLARTGTTIVASASPDGTTWTTIGSVTITLPTVAYVGLAVTSHTTSALNTATFDSVQITATAGLGLPGQDIGAVGLAGSTTAASGVYTVSGAGADIWGTADAFQYANTTLNGDGQIVARVTSIKNTNTYAKAGVMFRSALTAGAADVILDERPDGSIEFMSRTTAGGATSYIAGSAEAPPVWLKLQRSGTTVSGYISPDGKTWSQVGATTISLPTTAYVGLAVTSHDTTQLNTATFDNVAIATSTASTSTTPSEVVIYANDVPATGLHGTWTKVADSTAAAGVALETPDYGAAAISTALASPADYVDVTFTAAANTPYAIWIRLRATANSKYNDSAYVQFSDAQTNGAAAYGIGTASALLVNLATDGTGASIQGWGWQDGAYWLTQQVIVTFPVSGTHTMRVQVREDGVQFDQIVLSPQRFLTAAPGPATNDTTIVPRP